MLGVELSLTLSRMNFVSPDSKCYSFDSRGNGYGGGEGVGALVVKRLSTALKANDTIRAVVRATDSNHDGRTPGITQPNAAAQEQLIKMTYQKAGLDMSVTRYVEAHGTGTAVSRRVIYGQVSLLILVDWRSDRSKCHWWRVPTIPHLIGTNVYVSRHGIHVLAASCRVSKVDISP